LQFCENHRFPIGKSTILRVRALKNQRKIHQKTMQKLNKKLKAIKLPQNLDLGRSWAPFGKGLGHSWPSFGYFWAHFGRFLDAKNHIFLKHWS
jgi:hypothetical protein